ncbi:MAG: hypothetical protein HOV83_30325 [Catenulispora sp.]|nr:hypothetical protein [Catenulispora sp.]
MPGIGITTRTKLAVGCVVVALLTSACGGGSSGSGGGGAGSGAGSPGSTSGSSETATTPRTEGSGTEAPGKAAGGASVSLPSLPIGGAGPEPAEHQCVDVSWTGSEIIEGATITVTHVGFDAPGFVVESGRCGSPNCAASFTFRSSQTSCTLGVRATASKGATATVQMSGSAQCPEARRQWCADLKGGFSAIQVTQPSTSSSSSSSTDSSTSSDSTSKPTSPSTSNS